MSEISLVQVLSRANPSQSIEDLAKQSLMPDAPFNALVGNIAQSCLHRILTVAHSSASTSGQVLQDLGAFDAKLALSLGAPTGAAKGKAYAGNLFGDQAMVGAWVRRMVKDLELDREKAGQLVPLILTWVLASTTELYSLAEHQNDSQPQQPEKQSWFSGLVSGFSWQIRDERPDDLIVCLLDGKLSASQTETQAA